MLDLLIALLVVLASVATAAAEPPAALRVLSPPDGTLITRPEVTVRVAVRARPGLSVQRVAALLGDREIAHSRDIAVVDVQPAAELQPDEAPVQLSLTVPAADSVIVLRAETVEGPSEPVALHLRWAGAASSFTAPPRLYVLAVGVGKYGAGELRLTYPPKDAQDVAAAFGRQNGLLYREVTARVLIDGAATKAAILDGLEWIQRQTTVRDVAVVFLAGHGINDPGTGRYHFLPVDAELSSIKRTMLSQDELTGSLRSIAGKVVLFLDTCHAGNLLGEWATRGIDDLSPFMRELSSSDSGVVVFAASTGRQTSKESPAWGNGAFSKAVIEGVSGGASFVSGRPITVNMLDLYISERVKALTAGIQTPATAKPSSLPDFPIAVMPPGGLSGSASRLSPSPSSPSPSPSPSPLAGVERARARRVRYAVGFTVAAVAGLAIGLGLYFGLRPPETTLGVITPTF